LRVKSSPETLSRSPEMPETIPIACTLDEAEVPERGAQMAELGQNLVAVHAEDRGARLRFPADRSGDVDAFIAAESSCCPFFTFEKTITDTEVELAVSAPEDGEWAVRGLVAGFVAGWGRLV
jgi:hypothetical protein